MFVQIKNKPQVGQNNNGGIISFQKDRIYISSSIAKKLPAEHAKVYYDNDTKELAIKPVREKEDGAFKLSEANLSGRSISAKQIYRVLNWKPNLRAHFRPYKLNGYIAVDITSPVRVKELNKK